MNGFQTGDYNSAVNGALIITVQGMQNPRSLKISGSFQVYTYDARGYMIEYKLD